MENSIRISIVDYGIVNYFLRLLPHRRRMGMALHGHRIWILSFSVRAAEDGDRMLHTFFAVKGFLCKTAGLDDGAKTYIREYLTDINIHRIPPFCVVFFLMEATNFIFDMTTNAHPDFLLQYMTASLARAVVVVLFFFFTLFRVIRRPCSYQPPKTTCLAFWSLVAVGTSFFAV